MYYKGVMNFILEADWNQNQNRKQKTQVLFSNETFEKKSRTIIFDSDVHSGNHFESHLLGDGL